MVLKNNRLITYSIFYIFIRRFLKNALDEGMAKLRLKSIKSIIDKTELLAQLCKALIYSLNFDILLLTLKKFSTATLSGSNHFWSFQDDTSH